MNKTGFIIYLLMAIPIAGAGICALVRSPAASLRINVAIAAAETAVSLVVLSLVHTGSRIYISNDFLFIDALSAYHLCLVSAIFLLSSIYAVPYFADRKVSLSSKDSLSKYYSVLWNAFFGMLMVALCANNMGFLWIAIESSTLFSALLISTEGKPASVEAMWKYLLICSVGIALAFVGTLLLSLAAQPFGYPILWTTLVLHASSFDQTILLLSFIFALVGFGTKAGLAPMHTWLPDAHSQAPTPVSTVFSGVMLNVSLYCILRYLPIIDNGLALEGHRLLMGFGVLSMLIAAVFIPAQNDIKRLLAYHSVEHMGIIAIGIGLGGAGTIAALFHTLNHSLSKTLAFFSAGRLAQQYGSYDMRSMQGAVAANPLWGTGFLVSILVLIGMAPFSVFMSEFQIVKTAVVSHQSVTLGLFFVAATIIFISALKHAIHVSFGKQPTEIDMPAGKNVIAERGVVVILITVLLVSGLYLPRSFIDLLATMATIINGSGTPGVLP